MSYCRNSIKFLEKSGRTLVTAQSRFYRTEPVDYKDQDWFINAVVRIKTSLTPDELLKEINFIETDAGRVRNNLRFGPRTLDMDIIFYDDLIMNSSCLTLPHPRMHQRRFVLQPICDIDPDILHPVLKKDVKFLLKKLDNDEQKIFVYS
ncbi:2-amino-4-hydroxy-6-hydroxymethyldihydropteridine pyrophosphokinase [Desulfonema limicola]|uniref:2-amino-4-hydroxy-6-hydroxymethyldihydropteridine pyrophosphokinase n=1 Tax=Desulfonema limicola TaxID=45656 RepID=A0A975BBC9_9BACT|nr:2-amino-4-hydroxy-6-hydroxymethyldihydropteridine pyrophosphokinase [Desulfonema limicola]